MRQITRSQATAEDAERVPVVVPAGEGVLADLARPGVVPPARVGEAGDGVAPAPVAGPAEAGHLALAGLDGDRALAADRLQRLARGVALAPVADLGQELGGGDDRLRVQEEGAEDLPVGVFADEAADFVKSVICSTRGLRQATSTIARLASASTLPTLACGAERSRASSSPGRLRPQ